MSRSRHIDRHRIGRHKFEYYDDAGLVKDKALIAYFDSLAVPPAWREVRISRSKNANIIATGFDKAGRLQYLYSPRFRARQEKKKFERILRFARALPQMRRVTSQHLAEPGLSKQKVLACIVRLMDEAYFRVGNDQYEGYGATTLRSKHIRIDGDSVIFDFIGKSGQPQHKRVTDRRVTKIIKRLDDLPGYRIFKYFNDEGLLVEVRSADVNQYIKAVMGEEFSAKDFRTWGGTLLASAELAGAERATNERERKLTVTKCVARVARKLGNTPAIARSSYIDPRVINTYLKSDELRSLRRTVRKIDRASYLNRDERCVLKLLEKSA